MENKAHAMAAGIFVAVLTLLVLGLAAWLTRDTGGVRDTYEISTRESVTGLQEQAPVRFRGVDVGKVSSIGFDPKTIGNVLVRLQVDRRTPMTEDTFATLSYQGVTGLAFIQLADEGRPAPPLRPNPDDPPNIPLRPGLLARLEDRGEALIERVQEMTERVTQVLGDENQKRIASALENIAGAAKGTNELAVRLDNTVRQRLDPALVEATLTLKGTQRAVDRIGEVATQFGQTAERINAPGGAVDQIGAAATQLGETVARFSAPGGAAERISEGSDALAQAAQTFSATTLPQINRATEEATQTLRILQRAINELTEHPQMLLYGKGAPAPGPGERGFRVPEGRR